MPRPPRVQYENAVYHVMARGNRREPIVHDDGDRRLFLETFGEACGRTGWEVFAWVLMDNHYHAVFRTPEPNLVAGMQWFQNAYTRRLNTKRRLWGHVFGGRYKAIPVEDEATSPRGSLVWRDYLRTVIDYVHLNPGRAGLVDGAEKSILDFAWSSAAKGIALPPSKRPKWLAAELVLDLCGEDDTVASPCAASNSAGQFEPCQTFTKRTFSHQSVATDFNDLWDIPKLSVFHSHESRSNLPRTSRFSILKSNQDSGSVRGSHLSRADTGKQEASTDRFGFGSFPTPGKRLTSA